MNSLGAAVHRITLLMVRIGSLEMKHKRQIFLWIRNGQGHVDHHTFLPTYGFTVGEFALGQILHNETIQNPAKPRRHGKKNRM